MTGWRDAISWTMEDDVTKVREIQTEDARLFGDPIILQIMIEPMDITLCVGGLFSVVIRECDKVCHIGWN